MSLSRNSWKRIWRHEVIIGVLLIAVLTIAGLLMPEFLRPKSQLLLSRQMWEMAFLSLGLTLIIISGGIDLSVGSQMGLCAVMFGICHTAYGSPMLSSAACILTGTACGALNGSLVALTRLHPLIVTLATYAAYRGVAEGVSQGTSYSRFGEGFSQLARGMWLGIPLSGWCFAFAATAFAIFLNRTPSGRSLYAIGHNEQASGFSGIPVSWIRFWLYTLSGFLAGVSTVIYISRFDTASADAGKGFELDVITAVVIGGTSIQGGRGTIVGTVLGLLLIHETRLFISRYWKIDELRSVIIGFLLILSVLFSQLIVTYFRVDQNRNQT